MFSKPLNVASSHQIDNSCAQSEKKITKERGAPSGFIQAYPSSKPPQSVASINFSTMMEDSESLIRAYKKKKAELETLRDQFYHTET